MALEQCRLQMEERRLQWEQEQKISDRLVFVHILASHEVAPLWFSSTAIGIGFACMTVVPLFRLMLLSGHG